MSLEPIHEEVFGPIRDLDLRGNLVGNSNFMQLPQN